MKNQTVAIIASVLIIIFGAQTYMLLRLNHRVNALSQPNQPIDNPALGLPVFPKIIPKSLPDDFVNGRQWNPYEEMQRMQDNMEKMFGESFSRFHLNSPLGSLSKMPEIDLQDKPDHYRVTVNAPGADEASISVKMEDQLLSISIKTEQGQQDDGDQNGNYRYRERFVGEFHRTLTLPGPVNSEHMTTEYRNGVLTITVPKK